MPARVKVSVPGKVILMGEHAAVYGCPALVAAIDLRLRVEVRRGGNRVTLDLPDLGYRQSLAWSEVLRYRDRKQAAWSRYAADPRVGFDGVAGRDPAHVVKIALGEVARELATEAPPGVAVAISSDLPVGSGLGSSAAVAVGVVAAVLRCFNGDVSETRVSRLAMEVERRQHGMPSGVDHAAVLSGGVLEVVPGSTRTPLTPASWVSRDLALFDTGRPFESTGEVVAEVERRWASQWSTLESLVERMRGDVTAFAAQLVSDSVDENEIIAVVRDFEACLETIEVVPEPVRRAIRSVETAGGAAKISGAGALTGSGAGCLLVCRPPGRRSEIDAALGGYSALDAAIGARGLRVEEVA